MRRAPFMALVLLAACGQQQPASDSTAALAVDTFKPVVVDSVATPAVVSGTGAKSTTTSKTAPATTKKRDSLSPNIGYDSVIRPKGRMPADTPTKKP